jgi:hypothetical protein
MKHKVRIGHSKNLGSLLGEYAKSKNTKIDGNAAKKNDLLKVIFELDPL